MKLYYDTKKEVFTEQMSKTKSKSKVLITAEALRANSQPTNGGCPGSYISTINGIDFYWDDLSQTLMSWASGSDIRVYHPKSFSEVAYI